MQQPYLSICIFTYNRWENLSRCLESLFSQPEVDTGKIEVVVSDNASSDNTENICREYEKKYSCFKYFRHSTTVPAGDNLVYALSYGTGELLKLCKDTMIFQPGALAFLCEAIEKYRATKPLLWFSNGRLPAGKNLIVEGNVSSKFVQLTSCHVTDVSAVAVWKKDWLGLENELPIIRGSSFGHVKKICECLSNNPRWVIVHKKIHTLILPLGKDVSYGIYNVFYKDFISILNIYKEQGTITSEAVEKVRYDLLMQTFTYFIIGYMFHYPQYKFSQTENLREEIFNAYKNEIYFDDFRQKLSLLETTLQIEYKRLYDFCSTVRKTYLYGAGEGAQVVRDYLEKRGIKIAGYIVSPGHKLLEEINGIQVFEMDDFKIDVADAGIVITVGTKLQKEIIDGLNKRGYKDNIFIQKIFDMWNLE